MGERLICIQEVGGSIPPGSTIVDRLVAKTILYLMFSVEGLREMRNPGHQNCSLKICEFCQERLGSRTG